MRMKLVAVVALILTAALVGTALAKPRAKPVKVVGNAVNGKTLFVANCGTCHTLKAAGALGNIGPSLDKLGPSLTEATIIKQIQQGGATLMGKAAAKYTTQMVGYAGVLSTSQINDVAAFVFTSTHR